MAGVAEKTDPALWDRVKRKVVGGEKGGRPGQWSARKAQLAVHDYKEAGGGYRGDRPADNHLRQWQKEDWGTKSGKPSGRTGERYLPRAARAELTDKEYAETSARKREDTRKGRQFSPQPAKIASKTARHRAQASGELAALTRAALQLRAAKARIAGRSRMRKAELIKVLSR